MKVVRRVWFLQLSGIRLCSGFQPHILLGPTRLHEVLQSTPIETDPPISTLGIYPTIRRANGIQELTFQSNLTSSNINIRPTSYDLLQASLIGIATGYSVAAFKFSINLVRQLFYNRSILERNPALYAMCPALGGLVVGLLTCFGPFRQGLQGTVQEVDSMPTTAVQKLSCKVKSQLGYLRKVMGSVVTLGSGCSLGPEGPCVEIGMGIARGCMDGNRGPSKGNQHRDWNRLLLSCGAAAGVAAGFNAPIAGVFFSLEVMQEFFSSSDPTEERLFRPSDVLCANTGTAKIAPILLSSVLAALCARTVLGSHLALPVGASYSLKKPLLEIPLYVVLGAASASVSYAFNTLLKLSRSFYGGNLGSQPVRAFMRRFPDSLKPLTAGILCGLCSLKFPQILFFGYETLNPLLGNAGLPTLHLLSLLAVKMLATSVCATSGLVGGTFAPSLFLGAVTGASIHNLATFLLSPSLIADVPAYAIVGAGSVLAALFRAPMTACLLLFELTRDYDVILPLMASAGIGGVLGDILSGKASRFKKVLLSSKQRKEQESPAQA